MADWSELPQDLLRLIVHILVTYNDKVRFACVCTSWRSILPTISSKKIQPWLLLPRDSTKEKYGKFYDVRGRKVHFLEVPVGLGKKYRGSSHGWLVAVEDSPRISLFNPITGVQIALPPRYQFPDVRKYCAKERGTEYSLEPCYGDNSETYFEEASHVHEYFLDKVVLSSSPTSSKGNFMAVAIYGVNYNLAYCNLGDKKWTSVSKGQTSYSDAIFYEDKLYALTGRYELEVYELSAAYPEKVETVEPPEEVHSEMSYLVNTSIGLLQVHRYFRGIGSGDNYVYQTNYFNLYKYETRSRSWCKVESIGENVLFLGLNTSISIATIDLPPGGYYKGNDIYFTDDSVEQHCAGRGGYDIGSYSLDRRRCTTFFKRCNVNGRSWQYMCPTPIWYMNNPEDFINE